MTQDRRPTAAASGRPASAAFPVDFPDSPRPVGRPRDETASLALKDAARRLVASLGYGAVSISQLVAEAGVSRQSLYRRWPGKAELVLETFLEAAGDPPPLTRAEDAPAAVEAFLNTIFAHLAVDRPAMRSLIAEAQLDPKFRERFHRRFIIPREDLLIALLTRARDLGALPAEADPRLLSDMVHGAFWYRMLNDRPTDATLARALTLTVFPAADLPPLDRAA